MADKPDNDLEKAACEQANANLFTDFWYFLRDNKKWWLVPILVLLAILGLLTLLSTTPLAPFIYTLY